MGTRTRVINLWEYRMGNIVTVYQVILPSWFIWPGKVSLDTFYTRAAAEDYIDTYPLKYLSPYMSIEKKEIIIYDTD